MSERVTNGAMEFKPGMAMRFWRALGFRYSAYCGRPDDDEAKYRVHTIVTNWDWLDRLRILASGKTEMELCVETTNHEDLKNTRCQATVLAPDAQTRRV